MPELLVAVCFAASDPPPHCGSFGDPRTRPTPAPRPESLLITTRATRAPPGFIFGDLLARRVILLKGSTHFGDSRVDHESPKKRNGAKADLTAEAEASDAAWASAYASVLEWQ
jgi:hypothetical protein